MSLRGHPASRKQREKEKEAGRAIAAPSSGKEAPAAFVSKYNLDYLEAEKLYHAEDFDGALKAAKYNLTDPTYHLIKNHMLWAHAAESYAETEEHRLIAEQVYEEAKKLTAGSATLEQDALRKLREELDELAQYQAEDLREQNERSGEQEPPPVETALAFRGKDPEGDGDGDGNGKGKGRLRLSDFWDRV